MKEAYSLALMIALAMLPIASPAVAQTTGPEQPMRVTLYSAERRLCQWGLTEEELGPDVSRAYFSFTSGRLSTLSWDLSYGTLRRSDDWFVVGFGMGDDRSAIRDLWKIRLE